MKPFAFHRLLVVLFLFYRLPFSYASGFASSEAFYGKPVVLDFDGDGKLDLVTQDRDKTLYLKNMGRRRFQWAMAITNASFDLPDSRPFAADLDSDNVPDVVFPYHINSTTGRARLGNGVTVDAIPDLSGVIRNGSDGREDLVMTPQRLGNSGHETWRVGPDGQALVFGRELRLRPLWRGDLDGDGVPETLGERTGILMLLQGKPSGAAPFFIGSTNAAEAPLSTLTVADLDGDGRPEILRGGSASWTILTREPGPDFVYRRIVVTNLVDRRDSFDAGALAYPPLVSDLDGDGRPDVIVRDRVWFAPGLTPGVPVSIVPTNKPRPSAMVAVADLDGDGRPDLIGRRLESLTPATIVFWNDLTTNAAPVPPSPARLIAKADYNSVQLGWAAGDALCDRSSTFNLRVGTAPGASDIVSPLSTADGNRMVSGPGNMGGTFLRVLELPKGTYYWAVQEVNAAGVGGPFSEGAPFTISDIVVSSAPNTPPRLGLLSGVSQSSLQAGDTAFFRISIVDREQPVDTLNLSTQVTGRTDEIPSAEIVRSDTNIWLVVRSTPRSSGQYQIRVTAVDSGGLIGSVTAIAGFQATGGVQIVFDRLGFRATAGLPLTIPFTVVSGADSPPPIAVAILAGNRDAVVGAVRNDVIPGVPVVRWWLTFSPPETGIDGTNQLYRVQIRTTRSPMVTNEIQILVEPGLFASVPYAPGLQLSGGAAADSDGDGRYEAWFPGSTSFSAAFSPSNTFALSRFTAQRVGGPLRFVDWLGDGALQMCSVGAPAMARQFDLLSGPRLAFASAPTNFPTLNPYAMADLDGDGDEDAVSIDANTLGVLVSTRSNVLDAPRIVRGPAASWNIAAVSVPDRRSGIRWLAGRNSNGILQIGELRNGFVETYSFRAPNVPITAITQMGWTDINGDGLQDCWVAGATLRGTNVIQIFRRLDSDGMQFAPPQTIYDYVVAFPQWHDMDGDGYVDVPLLRRPAGSVPAVPLELWTADQNGDIQHARDLFGPISNSVTQLVPGDYDGDGRPDLLRVSSGARQTSILLNRFGHEARVPAAPQFVGFRYVDGRVLVGWSGVDGLATTYGIRIGTTQGGSELVSPLSGPDGRHRVFQPGNAGSTTNYLFNPTRTDARRIYVAVQAISPSFAGGPFTEEIGIDLDGATPPTISGPDTSDIRAGQESFFEARITDERSIPANVRVRPVIEGDGSAAVSLSNQRQAIYYPAADGLVRIPVRAFDGSAGRVVLRLEATDEAGLTSTNRFTLLVLPPNTPPFMAVPRQVSANAGVTTFTVWIGDRESESEMLILRAAWENQTNTAIVGIEGTGSARTVRINATGGPVTSGDLLVTVVDPGGLQQTARVTIGTEIGGAGTVGWLLSGDVPQLWTAHSIAAGKLRLLGRAQPGERYRIESSEDLSVWRTVTEGVATGAVVEAEVPMSSTSPAKLFHRLIRMD